MSTHRGALVDVRGLFPRCAVRFWCICVRPRLSVIRASSIALIIIAAAVRLGALGEPVRPTAPSPPVVYSAEVDAIIHPVSAEYMIETMQRADSSGAELVVFTLRTPGGLLDSTRNIISRMLAGRTPVAVFVGPAGARAASAGFLLTIAADVAAMAPGTHIGAAHPVTGAGEKMDETMARKAAADVAAYARTLAAKRRRNVALSEQAVNESRAFTEEEASSATPPLIDLVAVDVPDLLRKLDGRSITRFDGSTVVLHTRDARTVVIEMNWRQRLLSAIAHPNVAYVLFSLGTLGLAVELWTPGAILPGVVGTICLLLAFFAFQVLPVNYVGVLLIFLGLALFALEVKLTSYGLLTAGGLTSLILGSLILMDSSAPELRVSMRVIMPITLALATIMVFLVRLAIAAQHRRPVTGEPGMIDQAGQALTSIAPGRTGQVSTRGEIWSATATEPIAAGDAVRVVAVNGLTLTVRKG